MSWTLITAIYDIFHDIFYDNLRQPTTTYDNLRQPTTFYDIYDMSTTSLRQVYDILRHTRRRHLRGFFETFASIRLLLLLLSVVMDNIEDWLAQVHGILQSNADGFKSSLVFGNAMPEQSTKAIVKLESAVKLLLTSASSQFGDGSGGELDGRAAYGTVWRHFGRSDSELDGRAANQAAIWTAQRLEWPR
jgi:hypothetical protein